MSMTTTQTLREQVQDIIDEEWASEFQWMRPTIATSSEKLVSVVFFKGGWDEFESIEEARLHLRHMARIEKWG